MAKILSILKPFLKFKLILSYGIFYTSFSVAENVEDLPEISSGSFIIEQSEGGSNNPRLINKFEEYLSQNKCNLKVQVFNNIKGNLNTVSNATDLYFMPLIEGKQGKQIRLLKAVSQAGDYTQSAIVVRKNAGDKLDTVRGSHVSFVSPASKTGYNDQMDLLGRNKIIVDSGNIMFSGNHIGALSLLLHKDVFAAGVDRSLAEKWLDSNNLKIIGIGSKREVGGIYSPSDANINDSRSSGSASCLKALIKLSPRDKKHKRLMKVFPDWLTGFSD
ncbi:PhnD/SsuA/transferrin family substrate-binding protein [Aliikangiella sp. G2MR2-5]|uniref:PhnD/SsuA/transferrin family substrate-binding protein n=1 Tax=Aliikangiella sp. G2MR2-5 TaxID=2788943 RepID=UPI0018A9E655|nr:PhnD/SsuA/transferrin family substrate-binding protein [Aliikangiella sp. G2MR2-5]